MKRKTKKRGKQRNQKKRTGEKRKKNIYPTARSGAGIFRNPGQAARHSCSGRGRRGLGHGQWPVRDPVHPHGGSRNTPGALMATETGAGFPLQLRRARSSVSKGGSESVIRAVLRGRLSDLSFLRKPMFCGNKKWERK